MTPEPLLLNVFDACRMVGISKSLLYEILSAGQFPPPVKINSKTLFRTADLRKWVDSGCKCWEIS